ncbi:hypothetical protein F9C06_16685 [Klebsiella quasipneumoniae]|nr:hypothetical protein F9C06_16685 [Klebsiella quasipneumoniae]
MNKKKYTISREFINSIGNLQIETLFHENHPIPVNSINRMTQSCQKVIKLFSWKCVFTADISQLNILFEFIPKVYLYYQIISRNSF